MKTTTQHKTIHQRIEHFCQARIVLYIVLGLLVIAIIKIDSQLMKMMRQAYAEGFGLIGAYLREETTRTPIVFETGERAATISGR